MTVVRRSTSPTHLSGPAMLASVLTGDLNARLVTGHYQLLDGTPVQGVVKFATKTVLLDANSDLILLPETFTATLDETGAFSILLPVTDDPDISPIGWTYTVTEVFTNATGRPPYSIQVPYDAGAETSVSIRTLMTTSSDGTGTTAVTAASTPTDITIYQGDDFEFQFRVRDASRNYLDLTGSVPAAQIRASTLSDVVLADFDAQLADQAVSPGLVTLSLTSLQTAALDTGTKVWDVQITDPDGKVTTYLFGAVTIKPQVTR